MRKLLRNRATDRDADLIVVTDEGYTLDPMLNLYEAKQVISVLAGKVQAFYEGAKDRPCSHELDEMGES